jgi:hypothetical protein
VHVITSHSDSRVCSKCSPLSTNDLYFCMNCLLLGGGGEDDVTDNNNDVDSLFDSLIGHISYAFAKCLGSTVYLGGVLLLLHDGKWCVASKVPTIGDVALGGVVGRVARRKATHHLVRGQRVDYDVVPVATHGVVDVLVLMCGDLHVDASSVIQQIHRGELVLHIDAEHAGVWRLSASDDAALRDRAVCAVPRDAVVVMKAKLFNRNDTGVTVLSTPAAQSAGGSVDVLGWAPSAASRARRHCC